MRLQSMAMTMCCAAMLALATTSAHAQTQDRNRSDNQKASDARSQDGPDEKTIPDAPTPQDEQKNATNANDDPVSHYFAGKLLLLNQGTIRLSEVAKERSQTEEIKQFAQEIIDSHQQLTQKVKENCPVNAEALMVHFGQPSSKDSGSDSQQSDQSKSDVADDASQQQGDQRQDAQRRSNRTGAAANTVFKPAMPAQRVVSKLLDVQKQATKNYVDASTKMMEQYEGQDFDMAYLGFQIGMHTWALAELEAMQSESESDSQDQAAGKIVEETRSMIEQHLKKARELSRKFESQENPQDG